MDKLKVKEISLDNDETIIFIVRRYWFYLFYNTWHHILVVLICMYVIVFFIYSGKGLNLDNINFYGYDLNYKSWAIFYHTVVFIILAISFLFICYHYYLWSIRRLILTNKRLISIKRVSLFDQKIISILLSRITSVSTHKIGIIDFLFSTGKIVAETPSSEDEDIVITGIYKPEVFEKLINEQLRLLNKSDVNNNKINIAESAHNGNTNSNKVNTDTNNINTSGKIVNKKDIEEL